MGRVGYYQLISGKSEKNNCFSKFSSNSLDFIRWNLRKSWQFFFTDEAAKKFFPTSKISAQEIRHQFFLIWSNLTITAHIMGLKNQKAGKSLSSAKNLLITDRQVLLFEWVGGPSITNKKYVGQKTRSGQVSQWRIHTRKSLPNHPKQINSPKLRIFYPLLILLDD